MAISRLLLKKEFSSSLDRIVAVCADALPHLPVVAEEFSAKRFTTCLWHGRGHRVLYVGLGDQDKVTEAVYAKAMGIAAKQLQAVGASEIAWQVGDFGDWQQEAVAAMEIACYRFETFLPKDRRAKTAVKKWVLVGASAAQKKQAQAGVSIGQASNYVREMGNLPGNVIYPETLAKQARKLARESGLRCKVWKEAELKQEGFGGILAVGQGSAQAPRLIRLDYQGGKKGEAPIALVGKAITFDTGGISLKPGAEMDEMKFDKMGGVAVLGILRAAAALQLPINLTGVIASAENMPGAKAYRPGDIIRSYSGKTIEVLNTDAEGRIVLADALAYAAKVVKPAAMFDFATLTGACLVALGNLRAGIFAEDAAMTHAMQAAGDAVGERVWPLPLGDEFSEWVRSDVADVKNLGGRYGGASSAASFLKEWVGDVPWMHVDIAGPAWATAAEKFYSKGATGFGVRLFVRYLQDAKH